MIINHFVHDITNNSGGLKTAVSNLCLSIKQKKIKTNIYTFSNIDKIDPYILKNLKIRSFSDIFSFNFKRIFRFIRYFEEDFLSNKNVLIHIHGFWSFTPFMGYLVSKIFKKKYYLSPHGMLMPYAMSKKKFKKRLALFLYQKRIIDEADLIITASDNESSSVLDFNNSLSQVTIPHGISIPKYKKIKSSNNIKRALFLGRFNPTKGLDELLEIWNELKPKNWKLTVVGIIEDENYYKKIEAIKNISSENNIEIRGPAYGEEKEHLFKCSDLFILPTKTENFGLVILEALSYGIPVITTKAAPWQVLNDLEIGWCVDNNKSQLFDAISKATRLEINKLNLMGKKSKKFADLNFSWERLASQYLEAYLNN